MFYRIEKGYIGFKIQIAYLSHHELKYIQVLDSWYSYYNVSHSENKS